jgi:hypothetical protein
MPATTRADGAPRGSLWVPAVHVVEHTPLPPDQVLAAARDFSARRAELWPDVHLEHFEVHELGDTYAEVTEGNPEPFGFIWERLRYDWSQPNRVTATVTASNIFRPGSTWEIRATSEADGSRVEVLGVRHVKGVKGAIIGCIIRLGIGKRVVATHLRHFLATVAEAAR